MGASRVARLGLLGTLGGGGVGRVVFIVVVGPGCSSGASNARFFGDSAVESGAELERLHRGQELASSPPAKKFAAISKGSSTPPTTSPRVSR